MTSTESPKDSYDLDPVLFSGFERMSARARTAQPELPGLDESAAQATDAEVRIREAEAREAEYRAEFLPQRQRLALLERKTKLAMGVLATLFAMAYLVGALLLAPWILPPTGLAAAVAYRWR